jgi:hypothetical protein
MCPATGQPHRESDFRVGGSTICLDCKQKIATCCEGSPVIDPLPRPSPPSYNDR